MADFTIETGVGKGTVLKAEQLFLKPESIAWRCISVENFQAFAFGPQLVVIPQAPGVYHIAASDSTGAIGLATVTATETRSAGVLSRIAGGIGTAVGVVWPAFVTAGKYSLPIILGVALTLGTQHGCPGPGPSPVPPGPTPNPVDPPKPPAPIAGDGLRVLVVYESADVQNLPATQSALLKSQTFRDYLDSRCVPEGKTPAWRLWDKDVDTSKTAKQWQDAMKRPRGSLPWIVISDGKSGFEGPLPTTLDAAIELVKKWGNP